VSAPIAASRFLCHPLCHGVGGGPSCFVIKSAIAVTEPLAAISFPNTAPSRKAGRTAR
jgi:hypothetical protein